MRKRAVLRPVPAPRGSPRLVGLAYVSMALTVLLTTVPFTVGVEDTWVQIRMGEYIVHHGIPRTDPLSYTAEAGGEPFTEHEWLSCVLFYWIYRYGGAAGFVGWKLVVVGLIYFLVVQTARCLGAQRAILTLLFGVLPFVLWPRVVERPHLFSSLGLVTYHYLYTRVRLGELRPRCLWLLVPLHLLWTQLHGGHLQGIALLGVFGGGAAVEWLRTRTGGSRTGVPGRVVVQRLALPLGLLAVACINPYGVALLVYPWREVALNAALDWNVEWLAPHRAMYHTPFFWGYLLYLGGLWLAWFTRYPVRPPARRLLVGLTVGVCATALLLAIGYRPPPPPFALPTPVEGLQYLLLGLLLTLLGLWGVHTVGTWRTGDVTAAGVVLLSVGLSLRYGRALQDAVLLTFPLLTASLSAVWRRRVRDPGSPAQGRRLVTVGVGLMAAASLCVLGLRYPRPALVAPRLPVLGVGLHRPWHLDCVTAFFQRQGLTGHVFTFEAPWLLFQLYPAIRVQADTRLHVYGAALLDALYGAMRDTAAFKAYLEHFPTDLLVLRPRVLGLPDYQLLLHELGWVFIYLDDQRFVMAAPTLAHAALIQREGYRFILPWANMPVTVTNAREVLQEADRALHHCPTRARFAWAYKAEALRLLGRHEDSLAARRQIPPQLWIE